MAKRLPTRRQLEVLRAYIRAGSVAAAAYELGISETTARQHLSGLYRRTGSLNAAQAAYCLGTRDGARPIRLGPDRSDGPVRPVRVSSRAP
jgi:DNA-binding NarL/FixJ family response regulator